VAEEILEVPLPERPAEGPARRIPESLITQFGEDEEEEEVFEEEKDRISSTIPSTRVVGGSLQRLLDQLNNYDYQRGNLITFSIDVIEKATEGFEEKFRVGSGSFGTVYKLELGFGTVPLAIKLLHPTCSVIEEQFVTEINVLSRYRHENLVGLIGYCSNGPQFCLVYEFMAGGTLMEALASDAEVVLQWSKRLSIMLGVIRGIHYLHTALEKPLIHRDIKSANILLSGSHQPKIGDFGLAKSFSTTGAQTSALASTIFGTSAYMAPEAFRGDISPKMDVFSFGVILLEIITGLPPYDEEREGNDIVTYLEESVEDDNILPWVDPKPGDFSPEWASTLYQIALRCLAEKKRRPTSEVVLNDYQSFMLNFTHYCGKIF
jgi:interleukin-1 receptor-associated kinase 4